MERAGGPILCGRSGAGEGSTVEGNDAVGAAIVLDLLAGHLWLWIVALWRFRGDIVREFFG